MRTLNDYFITASLDAASTASSTFVAVPDKGKIIKIIMVQDGAVATADAAITFNTTESPTTVVTNSGITIPYAGDAVGDVRTSEPTALNAVNDGDYIKITTDGASSGTCKCNFTFVIRR